MRAADGIVEGKGMSATGQADENGAAKWISHRFPLALGPGEVGRPGGFGRAAIAGAEGLLELAWGQRQDTEWNQILHEDPPCAECTHRASHRSREE